MLKSLVSANLILVLQYAVSGFVSLLLVPHIVRQLGLSAFGSLAVALACANYGAVIVQYAFHYTGPRQLAQQTPGLDEKTVVCRVISAKLVLLAVVLSITGLAAMVTYGAGFRLSIAQLALLLCLPVAGAMHTGWHLLAVGRIGVVGLASILGSLAMLLVGFTLVQPDTTNAPFAAAVALSIGPLVGGLGTFLASVGRLGAQQFDVRWHPPWRELREGWPLFASQLVAMLYSASGPIVVAALSGMQEAGAYGVVDRVINSLVGACLLTHTVAYPKLARLYGTDHRAYRRLVGAIIGIYLAMATSVAAIVFAFWEPTLQFLFGAQSSGHGALLAVALAWLALAVFGTVLTGYLTVSGNGGAVLPLTLKILVLSFSLGVPGALLYGAWAWMAALVASQALVLAAAFSAWRVDARRGLVKQI